MPAWGVFEGAPCIRGSIPHLDKGNFSGHIRNNLSAIGPYLGAEEWGKFSSKVAQSHVFLICGAACLGFPGLGKEAQLLSGRCAFCLSQAVPTFCPFGRQLVNHPFLPLHYVALCSHPMTGFVSDIFQASG